MLPPVPSLTTSPDVEDVKFVDVWFKSRAPAPDAFEKILMLLPFIKILYSSDPAGIVMVEPS